MAEELGKIRLEDPKSIETDKTPDRLGSLSNIDISCSSTRRAFGPVARLRRPSRRPEFRRVAAPVERSAPLQDFRTAAKTCRAAGAKVAAPVERSAPLQGQGGASVTS
jgi:hypothetical protein